jgi:hypothetical protein
VAKKDFLNSHDYFSQMFQDFSNDLLDIIHSSSDPQVKQLFTGADVFDSFVNVMVYEVSKKPMRIHLCSKESRKVLFEQFIDILTN